MKNYALWSATPTPLLENFQLDVPSVGRMMQRHLQLGVDGVMLLGSCGEGPQVPNAQRRQLVEEAVAAAGQMPVAAQCTDNSSPRVLDQMEIFASAGATHVVMSQPDISFHMLVSNPAQFYLKIFERSPLPIIFYDRGNRAAAPVPADAMREILSHPKVKFIKDSSADLDRARTLISAKEFNPGLQVLSGSEFKAPSYLEADYDGFMLGGAIVNARYMQEMFRLWNAKDLAGVEAINERMKSMLYAIYGGTEITCWLSGLKKILVRLGTFTTIANYPGYELTTACESAIEEILVRDEKLLASS